MRIESTIARDEKLLFTLISYTAALVIFANLSALQSQLIGVLASIFYTSINSIFLGHTFFENQGSFLKFTLGTLLLTMLLGFTGWLVLETGNLDVSRTTLVLLITATLSSLLNRRTRHRNE